MKKIIFAMIAIVLLSGQVKASELTDLLPREMKFKMISNNLYDLKLINDFRSKDLQKKTYELCKKKDVNYADVLILAYKESSMKAHALNYNEPKVDKNGNVYMGASYDIGLMQINVAEEDFEKKQYLFDTYANIKRAINIIADIQDKYEPQTREELMIAYNMGAGGLERYRNGELRLSEKWIERQEHCEQFVEDQITKCFEKMVENGEMYISGGNNGKSNK